ncbi:MAG: two-component regulator propeller domain-containing protein [Ignavibacterium sp.]
MLPYFKTYIIAFICLLYLHPSFAQSGKLRFDQITVEDGLSNNTITNIFQDNYGFIWISTKYGLNRYDGNSFRQFFFQPGSNNSLTDNEINLVIQDSKNIFWIATQDGISLYNPIKDKITSFVFNDSLTSNEITALGEDKSGNIWIGTRKGLNFFNTSSNQLKIFTSNPSDKTSLSSSNIRFIYSDKNGNLWIGTLKGLCLYDFYSNNFRRFLNDSTNSSTIAGNIINKIGEDKKGNLWIATSSGLSKLVKVGDKIEFQNYYFDKGDEETKKLNRIRAFDFDSRGNIWIGTIGGGLIKFNPESGVFSNYQYSENDLFSINDNEIFSVLVDNFDNVWVGSPKNGLSKYSPSKSRFDLFKPESYTLKDAASNNISSILVDEGKIWLGTNGNGVFVYKLDENHYPADLLLKLDKDQKPSLSGNYVTSILKDKDGIIWIGTFAGGLNKYNPVTKKIEVYKTIIDDSTSISNNYINSLFEDSDGYIWVGTSAGGVNRFDKRENKFKRFTYSPGRKNNKSVNSPEVTCIYEDKKGRLWIGTIGGGLNLYQDNSFKHYSKQNGFVTNAVLAITEDKVGNLWLTTQNGLVKFNPESNETKSFDMSDGLQGMEFNPRAVFSYDSSSSIYFGGKKGLNIYKLKSEQLNLKTPNVVLTDFKIFNQSILPGEDSPLSESITFAKEINLSYDQDVISFQFASLDFTSPDKIQYAYMLEGFDKDWIYSGNNREVTYTNLSSGNYKFKVKATNSDGIWNEKGSEIKLTIHPPFWRTWWAMIIYILVAVLGLFAIRKYELNRIKLRNELRLREFETKKLQEVDQIKSRFFANLSHEFRTPLMLIKGPVEQLKDQINSGDVKSKLNMVSRNIQNLQTLIDQLLELSQLESASIPLKASKQNLAALLNGLISSFKLSAEQKNISLSFKANSENLFAWVDVDKFEKVINNLLSNALKFTEAGGKVTVSLDSIVFDNKEFAQIVIADTGIGIEKDKIDKIFDRFYQAEDSTNKKYGGSGIGLSLVKELSNLHKWDISVKSELNVGTEFTIKIPMWDYLDEDQKLKDVAASSETIKEEKKVLSSEISESVKSIKDENGKKPTILIVEDSEDVRLYLSTLLKNEYEILEAENGIKGLETAAQNSPDLIISDVMMPSMDGIEFCKRIKTNWETSHIPVILLTAKVSQESKLEGLETGADEYLIKPFESRELFIRIKNLLEQRKRLKEKFAKSILLSAETVATTSIDNEFLNKAFDVIEKNMSNPDFTAENLAKELLMSLSQLRRKLLALTGESPGEFLRVYRLKRAAQMIIENKLSITQIAFEVGYNSPSHFTKAFQQQFNCTPSEFSDKGKITS